MTNGPGVSNLGNLPELSIEEIATIMQIPLVLAGMPGRLVESVTSIAGPSQARS
ncbi:MAG: hypothetical protein ACSLFM_12405 [Tepidiformaceae bacterium]